MKKNLILVAIAAVAMTSCSNEIDNIVPVDSSLKAIEFRPLVTRALESTAQVDANGIKADANGFTVFAYNGVGSDLAATDKLYMDFVNVKWESDAWETSSTQYWPSGKLHFFAYYPADALGDKAAAGNTFITAATGTSLDIPYTVSNANPTKDFMIATNPAQVYNKDAGVSLQFAHVLTQIRLAVESVASEGIYYTINSITIENVNSAGTWNTSAKTWTSGTPVTYTAPIVTATATDFTKASATNLALLTANTGLMLLPQTFGAGAQIRINYEAWTAASKGGTSIVAANDAIISLKGVEWEAATTYTYGISFNEQHTISIGSVGESGWAPSVAGPVEDTEE